MASPLNYIVKKLLRESLFRLSFRAEREREPINQALPFSIRRFTAEIGRENNITRFCRMIHRFAFAQRILDHKSVIFPSGSARLQPYSALGNNLR
jgi:hypothetical protein